MKNDFKIIECTMTSGNQLEINYFVKNGKFLRPSIKISYNNFSTRTNRQKKEVIIAANFVAILVFAVLTHVIICTRPARNRYVGFCEISKQK